MADENLEQISGQLELEEKTSGSTEPEIFPAYALYRYHANRPTESPSEQNEESEDSKSETNSVDSLRKNTTGEGSFSLTVVLTSLDSDHEECLRKFITRRLFRGNMYSRSGHIANVDLSCEVDEDLAGLCYYCLLEQSTPSGGATGTSSTSGEYVVCFLTSTSVLLDLFRSELDRYSGGLVSLIQSDPDLDQSVKPYLHQWYDTVTKYLCRCVNILGDDIRYLIHAALSNARVEVSCSQQDLKMDINKFVQCCSLAELLDSGHSGEKTDSSSNLSETGALLVDLTGPLGVEATGVDDTQTPVVTLKIDTDNTHTFQNQECTQFCEDWAQTLTNGDPTNPVFIRQIIDSFKLKAIHDMNTLKRLLRLAEADHYALYRCYAFLCSCGNGSILMQHAQIENGASGSATATQVLRVLQEHIQESDGFQLPKKKIPAAVS